MSVETPIVMDCQYEDKTYGPNCSITAYTIPTDALGTTLTIDPATASYCYDDKCYFYLVQKNREVTVMPTNLSESLAVLYKTNNFPTSTDYDVAMPGATSFIPDIIETETTAQLVVYSLSGNPFTIEIGEGAPSPPPPLPLKMTMSFLGLGLVFLLLLE